MPDAPPTAETATFGAGCFWCIEAVLLRLDGVRTVRPGYMGGTLADPSYADICTGRTGHAEVVEVVFDPERIGFDELLAWFWRLHDPTQLNRQGQDVGTQYRSVVFTHSTEQRRAAEASRGSAAADFDDPIVTEINPAGTFWPAEDDHRDYYRRNGDQPYCRLVIAPKLAKLELDR